MVVSRQVRSARVCVCVVHAAAAPTRCASVARCCAVYGKLSLRLSSYTLKQHPRYSKRWAVSVADFPLHFALFLADYLYFCVQFYLTFVILLNNQL